MLRSVFILGIVTVLTISGSQSRILKREAEENPPGPPAGPPPPVIGGPPPWVGGPPPGVGGPPPGVGGPPPGVGGPADSVCPKPTPIATLDIDRYLGTWYQSQGIPTFFSPSGTKCIRAVYGKHENGSVSVHNVATKVDGTFTEVCGFAVVPDPAVPGSLSVKFPFGPPGSYNVLDTDYDNFAAVYSCSNIPGLGKSEYGWVLTRSTTPSQEVIEAGRKVFADKGISLDKFEKDYQSDTCVYENPDGPSCAKKE